MNVRWFAPLVVIALANAALAECLCERARVHGGWCSDCKKGYVAGVAIQSQELFQALEGKSVDPAAVKCEGCKAAQKDNGHCEKCSAWFARGRMYSSALAHSLALGEPVEPDRLTCESCRKAAADHGWCSQCQAGYVGALRFTDQKQYERALQAHQTLRAAAAAPCAGCALAMVRDGRCDACNVAYKDGKKVAPPQP